MTIAEKIVKLDEDANKLIDLNNDFEETLYGTSYGGKSHYDIFWDVYQTNGTRRNYQYGAFSGMGWTNETFKPKYPIIARDVYGMFQGTSITEIKDIDFSPATAFNSVFAYSTKVLKIGEINVPKATRMEVTFNGCTNLHTIAKITVSESCAFTSTFNNCSALQNVVFDGVIGNSINFSPCTKLTQDSITSIINHLSDTVNGKTLTLSITAVKNAFEGSTWDSNGDGKADTVMGSQEWVDLQNTKPNWTITLV